MPLSTATVPQRLAPMYHPSQMGAFPEQSLCAPVPGPRQRVAWLWAVGACAPRCLTGILFIPGTPWGHGHQSRVSPAEPAGSGLQPPPVPRVTTHGSWAEGSSLRSQRWLAPLGAPPRGAGEQAEGDYSPAAVVPEARVPHLPFLGSQSAQGGVGGWALRNRAAGLWARGEGAGPWSGQH